MRTKPPAAWQRRLHMIEKLSIEKTGDCRQAPLTAANHRTGSVGPGGFAK